jgi:hypothetical protein
VIAHGLPIYVALEPVDMRMGSERLGALVRERMHAEPRQYLEEILRVLPYWQRDRYLELSPKYWRATRGRLRADELATPISAFEVPPPLGQATTVSASAGPSP